LKKAAKALAKAVGEGDSDAIARAQRVHRDFSAENFGQMKALHVIATEHGFRSWGELLEAPAEDVYTAITRVRGKRRFDLQTQERIRELIRLHEIAVPNDVMQRPIHMLSVFAITGGQSATLADAVAMARENARRKMWAIDLGHYQTGGPERQALAFVESLKREGIPFWDERLGSTYWMALEAPSALPRQYQEICETFGEPVVPAQTPEAQRARKQRVLRAYCDYETAESAGAVGTFQVIELQEDDRDVTELVDQGIHFQSIAELERYLREVTGVDVIVEEGS
jgi:hypothetical protein